MTRTKLVLGAVVVTGAILAVVLFGTRSGARPAAEAPAATVPMVDPEAQRAQQEAWRNAVAPPKGAPPAAVDPDSLSAVEIRDQALARVRASGPAAAGTRERAQAVGAGWAALAKKLGMRAKIGPWECHAAACLSTIVHQSVKDVAIFANAVSRQDDFRRWNGRKMRTGPVTHPDGTTEITWILYSGDETPPNP